MKINIRESDGRWTVNNKPLSEMNAEEKQFMNDFFREVKLEKAEI